MDKLIKFLNLYRSEIILGVVIVLLTTISYNLGKITAYNKLKQPVVINSPSVDLDSNNIVRPTGQGNVSRNSMVVASKKSTSKLYHFTWCPGASKIAEQNKLSFPNEATAIAAGYTLASNCKK